MRVAGSIGSSLAAEVDILASGERYRALASLGQDLRFVMITSRADAKEVGSPAQHGIVARPSVHGKCPRCWHLRPDIGASAVHPELCGRCASNLQGPGETRAYA